MYKKIPFLVLAVALLAFITSCSEEKTEQTNASDKESLDIPKMDVKALYAEALELLEKGEEMASIEKIQGKSACLDHFKANNSRTRELRKIVDTYYSENYKPLAAAFAHLTNCTSCLNSQDQCDVSKGLLKEVDNMYHLSE